jgi:hypothetical protein
VKEEFNFACWKRIDKMPYIYGSIYCSFLISFLSSLEFQISLDQSLKDLSWIFKLHHFYVCDFFLLIIRFKGFFCVGL